VSTARNRAHAGSSRALADHGAAVETAVILSLAGNVTKSFSQLVRELTPPVSQSALAAGLATLLADGWLHRTVSGNYQLSARGLDMLAASRRQHGRQSRRAA
jgi:DNA-binding HxlR family transcriptional regulator